MSKTTLTTLIVAALIVGIGAVYFFTRSSTVSVNQAVDTGTSVTTTQTPTTTESQTTPATSTATATEENAPQTVIGQSAGGHDIMAYHFGSGSTEVVFVGGIHGGYEWNTALEAYQLIDYLKTNPAAVPSNEKITVIPVLNPDGLQKVVGTTGEFTAADVPSSVAATVPGRFNADNVDLNRNFDCDWQAQGTWQNQTVSGGTGAFSEPESQAMRKYIQDHNPSAVIVWYSAAGGVYASNCHNGILPDTTTLMNTYAKASGYKAYQSFDYYAITGDMVNWLAKENIPAISVLLTNHTDTEWDKNLAGIKAVIAHYAQ